MIRRGCARGGHADLPAIRDAPRLARQCAAETRRPQATIGAMTPPLVPAGPNASGAGGFAEEPDNVGPHDT